MTRSADLCKICDSAALVIVDAFGELPRVASDVRPYPAGGQLAQCMNCGTIQKPATAGWTADCAHIYANYDLYHQSGGAEQQVADLRTGGMTSRSAILVAHVLKHLDTSRAGVMLDVGCSNGATLKAFAQAVEGWRLDGFEMDRRHESALATIPGFSRLHTEHLSKIPDRYDLITMIHSLEHFERPLQPLEVLRDKLSARGRLVVQVPNVVLNPFDLLLADHATHFSPAALEHLLHRAGYRILRIATDWISKEISAVAEIRQGPDSSAPHAPEEMLSVAPYVQWLSMVASQLRGAAARSGSLGIFGTGIAGIWLGAIGGERISFYVDEAETRINRQMFGKPILAPRDVPAGARVYLGLAPILAAAVGNRLTALGIEVLTPPPLPPQSKIA